MNNKYHPLTKNILVQSVKAVKSKLSVVFTRLETFKISTKWLKFET